MKEYILFDLDGTLTDPKLGITSCVQYALKSFGIEENDLDKLEPFIGPPLKDSFMNFYGFSEEQAAEAIVKYRERFSVTGLFENEVYEGIPKMLHTLKKKGMHLAVASSKATVYVERILEHFGLRQYFEVVMGSELDGRRVNKDEVIEEALRQLFGDREPEKEKIYMVGDRKFDVEGARIRQIESVGVSYGYGSLEELKGAGADYIVESVSELQYLLLREFREVEPRGVKQIWLPAFGALGCYLVATHWGGILPVFLMGLVVFPWAKAAIERTRYDMYVAHVRKDLLISHVIALFVALSLTLGLDILIQNIGNLKAVVTYPYLEEITTGGSLWKMLICVGVILPIVEEFIFRGILFNIFRFKMKLPLAILSTALLYGVLQDSIGKGICFIILGILYAYAYEYFGTFAMPVILHVVSNVLWVFVSYLGVSEGGLYNIPAGIVLLIIAIVGMGVLHKEKRIL